MIKQRLWTALLVGGIITTSAYAQADKGESEDITQKVFELNPVVVTGTGTHQRLKNTPAPVSVITANEIKRAGITDFQQAMTMMVPSLSFSPNAMGSYLMMNGLSNKYVLILVNGRKMTGDISGNIDISQIDMSRVKRFFTLWFRCHSRCYQYHYQSAQRGNILFFEQSLYGKESIYPRPQFGYCQRKVRIIYSL